MNSLYVLNVTIHILAAFLWLGGMFFLAVVGAPVLRRIESPELRSRLFRDIGEQFRRVGWVCIAVLLVTGVLNLQYRGLLHREVLTSSNFWSSAYGHALAGKLTAVVVMVVISAIHDFAQGPRASRFTPGSPEALKARRRAAVLARINAGLGILVVWAAVRLSRGG